MMLSPHHSRLSSWQIILLEVLELLMIQPAHVLGSEHSFLEYISFHRGKMYYTALKNREEIISLLFSHLVALEIVGCLTVVDELE